MADDVTPVSSIIRMQARLQKKNAKIIKLLIIFLMIIALLVLPLWAAYLFMIGIGPGFFSKIPDYIYIVTALLVYGIFFIVPFLLCLPVVIPFALQQKNIGRIIILRKFNDDLSKKPLRRIVKTDLSNYGHVFTLSDKNFKVKWYVRIPLVLGQMSFFHFRQKIISTKKDIAILEKKLSATLWLNVNWLLSFGKIFSIKTTDELWKETATTLLKENSLILFDTSYDTDSLEWEFTEIKKLGYTRNLIAITNSEKLLGESKWKNIFNSQKDIQIPVFYYDKKGKMPEKLDFDFTVARMLATSFKEEDWQTSKNSFYKRTIATAGIALLLFLCSFFFLSPYIIPDITGKISPLGNQVITAYMQSKVHSTWNENKDTLNQRIIQERIEKHWKKKAEASFLNYATHHKEAECSAVQSIMVEFPDASKFKKYINLTLTAEPAIADSAASIILRFNPPTLGQIALLCIGNERIDVKERGLRLLNKTSLDTNFVAAIMHVLEKNKASKQVFKGHDAAADIFNFSDSPASLITSESTFYINLANILKYNRYISVQSLKALLNSSFYQLRIFAALILAEKNNASGIRQLIKATFINSQHHYALFDEYYTFYPYKDKVDSLLFAFNNPASLPQMDTINSLLNDYYFHVEDSSTLTALFGFIIRNYPVADFKLLIQNIPDNKINELKDALEYCLDADTSEVYKKVQHLIALSKPLFMKNINIQSMNSKLRIAALLAYTGDTSSISILKEAADDNIVLGDTHIYLHKKKIKNILEILYKNVNPTNRLSLYKSKNAQLLTQIFMNN